MNQSRKMWCVYFCYWYHLSAVVKLNNALAAVCIVDCFILLDLLRKDKVPGSGVFFFFWCLEVGVAGMALVVAKMVLNIAGIVTWVLCFIMACCCLLYSFFHANLDLFSGS
ncbi:hypothetical protein Ancab_011777 [Ancistrocladus abbreviatus]